MKIIIGLCVFLLAVSFAVSLPARSLQDDAEVISGPRRVGIQRTTADGFDSDEDIFRGVITSHVGGYPFLQPSPHAFSWSFLDALNEQWRRLHGLITADDSAEESRPSLIPSITSDQNKINSTSVVKVVGGHKVEINNTVYGNENNLYRVRLVAIVPLDSDEKPVEGTFTWDGSTKQPSTSKPTEADSNEDDEKREPLEKSTGENEINPNIDELEVTKIK